MATSKKELYEILSSNRRKYHRSYMDPVPGGDDSEKIPEENPPAIEKTEKPVENTDAKDSNDFSAVEVEEKIIETPAKAPVVKQKPVIKQSSDLVISLETGMAAFFVVLILVSSAFYLGYQKGSGDVLLNLDSRIISENDNIKTGDSKNINIADNFSESRKNSVVLPADAYVLRIISYEKNGPGLTRSKQDLAYAKTQSILADIGMNAFLLENSAAYSVCIGPAKKRHNPELEKLRKIFINLDGPPSSRGNKPYAGSFVERVDKLGRVLQ